MAGTQALRWGGIPFRRVHVASLALCTIFLPWSTAYLSIAQMLMVANWIVWGIADRSAGHRWRTAFGTTPALVFLSFWGLHVVGLAWTSTQGLPWGMDLARILLPVLTFGAVLSSSPRLSGAELRTVLLLGAWSTLVSTGACLALTEGDLTDYRARSIFISHIRLALLLCLSIAFFLLHWPRRWWARGGHVLGIAWAVTYLELLGSVQGFAILGVLVLLVLWWQARHWRPGPRFALRSAVVILPAALALVAVQYLWRPLVLPVPAESGWGAYTATGEPYTFDATNPQQENGHHVWAWIAWGEVERTWPRRSTIPLDGHDAAGRPLRGTLVRYLTSLHLRKDSAGVMALSDADIAAIEQGRTNAQALARGTLLARLDEVRFELDQYRAYGRANGHSVTMRLEFWRAGLGILHDHWPFGVGTGDTQVAFDEQYARMGSTLAPEWRFRAHQQYLTLFISFGLLGGLWCLFALAWPAWAMGAWRDPHFLVWALVLGIAGLTDDTIETQAGATLFALYYALFVFASPTTGRPGASSAANT